jgi:transcriptional regulator with XRE-family HTH domain
MLAMAKNRIKRVRLELGVTQTELANRLGTSAQQLGRLEAGKRQLTTTWLEKIAEALGVDIFALLESRETRKTTVPLLGFIGAESMYYPDPKAGHWRQCGLVDSPAGTTESTACLKVVGSSLYPVYRDGDLLFFERQGEDPRDCLGRDCVIMLPGGEIYLKRLEASSSGFRLVAYNKPDIEVEAVAWAAPVVWVRRA